MPAFHETGARVTCQMKIEGILAAAGLPILRVKVVGRYDERELRERIRGMLRAA
jgi:hypothetical protein